MTPAKDILQRLDKIDNLQVKFDIPLKNYTSFRVGGPAEIFLIPGNIEALKKALAAVRDSDKPLFILGRGSNVIAADSGFKGIIIYTGQLNKIKVAGSKIVAECGVTLNNLADKALEHGLSGLEFISGIPGSLGGAICMNAGAYGREIKDVTESVLVVDYSGKEVKMKQKQLAFSYRYSILQDKTLIAVRAVLQLTPGNRDKIHSEMKKLRQKRKDKQPLKWPSAGSTFKRPPNNYAGSLIEKAGMKGARIGDAQVSNKHAGFIINRGNATAGEIRELIIKTREKVYDMSGIRLEVEPHFIGRF